MLKLASPSYPYPAQSNIKEAPMLGNYGFNTDSPEYAIYLPSRMELRIVTHIDDTPEMEEFKVVLHRPNGITPDEVEAMCKMYRATTGHFIAVIRHNFNWEGNH